MAELPGADIVAEGLRDLEQGAWTAAALLVAVGSPRLRRLGLAVPEAAARCERPERRLYELLAAESARGAHARYNALIGRLVSYERALAAEQGRAERARRSVSRRDAP